MQKWGADSYSRFRIRVFGMCMPQREDRVYRSYLLHVFASLISSAFLKRLACCYTCNSHKGYRLVASASLVASIVLLHLHLSHTLSWFWSQTVHLDLKPSILILALQLSWFLGVALVIASWFLGVALEMVSSWYHGLVCEIVSWWLPIDCGCERLIVL